MVHSKYWRSPHWSYEFSYFFEIAPNPKLRNQLLTENKLRLVIGGEAATAKQNLFGETPAWFAPKTVTEYDVWIFAEASYRNFVVLIDRESGRMFLSDFVV